MYGLGWSIDEQELVRDDFWLHSVLLAQDSDLSCLKFGDFRILIHDSIVRYSVHDIEPGLTYHLMLRLGFALQQAKRISTAG